MNEQELIANLLRGAEKQQNDFKDACESLSMVISELTKAFIKRGFDEEKSMFLALRTFEIMVKQARSEAE